MMQLISNNYNKLFNSIAKNRIVDGDTNIQQIHTLIIAVLTTTVLMWSYVFIALNTIQSHALTIIGVTASILHLFSPYLLRWSKNIVAISSFMLATGVVYQTSFAFYTGGFSSSVLVWFGIIPILGGLISGKKYIIVWSVVVSCIALSFLILESQGVVFFQMITENASFASHSLLVFGWVIVNGIVLYNYEYLIETKEDELKGQNDKVNKLLKILMHDMSNSICVIGGTADILLSKDVQDRNILKKYKALKEHSDFLTDIIRSTKSMYIADDLISRVKPKKVELNKAVSFIVHILDNRIAEKEIKINYDFSNNSDKFIRVAPGLFEDHVLQNVLTNAIKFSHPGGEIDITVDDENSYFKMSIRDYGIGMPPEIKENLFNSQYKTTRLGTENERGTGFGMLILKDVIEKINGEVTVNSVKDKGTEFVLHIKKA